MYHATVGDIIEFKRPHPCGSRSWRLVHVGSEVRLECTGCERQVVLSSAEVDRRFRRLVCVGENLEQENTETELPVLVFLDVYANGISVLAASICQTLYPQRVSVAAAGKSVDGCVSPALRNFFKNRYAQQLKELPEKSTVPFLADDAYELIDTGQLFSLKLNPDTVVCFGDPHTFVPLGEYRRERWRTTLGLDAGLSDYFLAADEIEHQLNGLVPLLRRRK